VAAFLVDHGADIDARDVDHESTPAQYVVRESPDVARYLVSRGCETDILLGAALGDTAVVGRHLAENPASIRTSVDATWFPMKNPHAGGKIYIWSLGARKTAHTIARELGHADVERQLWDASDDSLSLAMACELGHDDLIGALTSSRPELVRALQPADAVRIVAAAELRNGPGVRRMLAIGWPAGVVDRGGLTALHWAGFHGDAATTRALVAAGAPLDVKDDVHGGTPLGWALWGSVHGWHRQDGDYAGTVTAMLDGGATPPEITDALVASDAVKRLLTKRKS
jgi:ankyrin repeat protein